MTTHDDVALRLRAWMEDAAPSREPAGLVDRVATGTARVRQRPAILVRTGLRERRLALSALSPVARLLLLALALLAATVAALAIGSRALLVSSVDPGPRLVYMLDGDIYVAAEDGTDPVRIVEGDADDQCGGLRGNRGLVSPDGRHIAYRTEWSDECPGTVVIADPDGRLVASVPGAGWDIAWAPDGTRFATWLSFGGSIGVYGIDGSLQAELDGSSVFSGGDRDPRWAPDGTALLLPAETVTAGVSHYLVARLPLDGGAPEILPVTDPLSIRSVSFSPDGTRVASVGPDSQLVVATLDGTPPGSEFHFTPGERVDAGWARRPLWSPDGDRIAVVVRRWSSARLSVVDPTTGLETALARVEGEGDLQPIAFSRDGERILVQEHRSDGVSGLSSVNADGSGSTMITAGADHGEWLSPPAE
jgi:Tol biopolymer transport system component